MRKRNKLRALSVGIGEGTESTQAAEHATGQEDGEGLTRYGDRGEPERDDHLGGRSREEGEPDDEDDVERPRAGQQVGESRRAWIRMPSRPCPPTASRE